MLAGCLGPDGDVAAGFERYQALRLARTAGIQNGSRRNASVFHLSGIKAWLRNRAANAAGGKAMDTLFRYDALSVANTQ